MRSLSWLALLSLGLLQGCDAPKPGCGPSNCTGCCHSDGSCQPGNLNVACGNSGNLCDVCSFSDRCELGACFPVQGIGGGGGSATGGGGAPGGGGVTGGGGGATGGGG